MPSEQQIQFNLFYKFSSDQLNGGAMRRILVVNNGLLLEDGIVRLLESREGLDVLSIKFENDDVFIRDIDTMHPDVIILNREASVDLARLFVLLASVPDFRRLQILVVSADSNVIDVYENQQVHQLHSQNFLDFIECIDNQ